MPNTITTERNLLTKEVLVANNYRNFLSTLLLISYADKSSGHTEDAYIRMHDHIRKFVNSYITAADMWGHIEKSLQMDTRGNIRNYLEKTASIVNCGVEPDTFFRSVVWTAAKLIEVHAQQNNLSNRHAKYPVLSSERKYSILMDCLHPVMINEISVLEQSGRSRLITYSTKSSKCDSRETFLNLDVMKTISLEYTNHYKVKEFTKELLTYISKICFCYMTYIVKNTLVVSEQRKTNRRNSAFYTATIRKQFQLLNKLSTSAEEASNKSRTNQSRTKPSSTKSSENLELSNYYANMTALCMTKPRKKPIDECSTYKKVSKSVKIKLKDLYTALQTMEFPGKDVLLIELKYMFEF
ncbi:hypothetical protein GJ496_006566 [Pomphorhynchus laevis]|nr:hypothetical protein GJ496_006566 [Pomphorhynchus laevis]